MVSIQTDKRVLDILVDEDFIHYVINPTDSLTEQWNNYFKNNPDYVQAANQARKILLCEGDLVTLSDFEAKELEIEIFDKCGLIQYS